MIDRSQTRKTYNTRIYGNYVSKIVDNVHDYYYLCNQLANHYRLIDDGCVSDFRATKVSRGGRVPQSYIDERKYWCCAISTEKCTNEKTGNTFVTSFNYGH